MPELHWPKANNPQTQNAAETAALPGDGYFRRPKTATPVGVPT